MSASRPPRTRGLTLLEVIIAVAIFAIIMVMFSSLFTEATNVSKVGTLDAELRARATTVLGRIVNDLRSTQCGSGVLTITGMGSQTQLHKLQFYPIIGYTSAPPGPRFGGAQSYSWDPTQTTQPGANWQLSQLILTPYNNSGVAISGDVFDFTVTPIGTTQTSGFATTSPPLTLEIFLTLTRANVNAGGDTGTKVSVTVTTNVTVPPG